MSRMFWLCVGGTVLNASLLTWTVRVPEISNAGPCFIVGGVGFALGAVFHFLNGRLSR